MGDLHDFLRQGTSGLERSTEEGLERTLGRARRRQRRRQAVAFLTVASFFAATVAGVVILRDSRGLPLAGPTPTPSPLRGTVVTDEGTWICHPAFRNQGTYCLARVSEVVDVASGVHEGLAWSVRAFVAFYDGPDFSRAPDDMAGTRLRRAMVCTHWRVEGTPLASFCQRSTGPDALFGMEAPPSLTTLPIARPLEPLDTSPLSGVEDSGGGFLAQDAGPWRAILAWTPQGTARLEISVDGTVLAPAALVGPFEELRTSLKWFVAFLPREAREVTYTAYDAEDSILWRETDRYSSNAGAGEPQDRPTLQRLPADRTVVAAGTDSGRGWEVFTFRSSEGPIYGYALDSGEWSYTEDPEPHPDPCGVRSNSIHWIYLRQDPDRTVVLQFAPIPPEVARVTFRLNDGSSVGGRVVSVDDEAISWNMFTVVFEGSPEIRVSEIILEGSDGARLNDPATC